MPTCGLPGGVSRAITEDERKTIIEAGEYGVEFCKVALGLFNDVVLKIKTTLTLLLGMSTSIKHTTWDWLMKITR